MTPRYGAIGQDKLEMDRSVASFGRRLKAVRMTTDVSQEKLARRCFLRHEAISDLERGARAPNLVVLLLVAEGLGVSIQALTEGVIVPRREDSTCRTLELVDEQPGISMSTLTQSLALPEPYVRTLTSYLEATGQVLFGRTSDGLTVRRALRCSNEQRSFAEVGVARRSRRDN
jgi:transcriptional regulator with XRE-family HTH domain